ncbi:MAG: hypothetical protein KatS3mg126_1480 [Lysobacteraceae bacterium]|nr:MAG: hypothetical protein KatS3mg126_1480 [Xanthomonadaceae bacterium]
MGRYWASLEDASDLASLRSRLLDNVLLLIAITGTPGIALSVARAMDFGWHPFLTVQVGLLAVLWLLWAARERLAFGVRLGALVLLMTSLAFTALAQLGPAADARFLLVLLTLLLGLLVGAVQTLAFVALCVVLLTVFGLVAVIEGLPLVIDYPSYVRSPLAWASMTYNLMVHAGAVAYIAYSLIAHLQRKAELIERTGELAGIGTFECMRSGRVRLATPIRRLLALEEDPRSLQEWLALFDEPQGRGALAEALERTRRSGESFALELSARAADGRPLWLRVVGRPAPVRDGQLVLEGLVQDLSAQAQGELTKREFVATVSHELRTPLAAITGALDLLGSQQLGALPPSAAGLIEVAQRNGERLRQLIDDLLDAERLESGRMRLISERVRIGALLERAVEVHRPLAAARGLRLEARGQEDPAVVEVDRLRMEQVLANLIANAVKFSPQGEAVELALETPSPGWVRVLVRDHGPGVPERFREKLFQRFAQADASDTRAPGGTGLGLYISRCLVERMGGRIGYRPGEGGGSVFFVDLPRASAASP